MAPDVFSNCGIEMMDRPRVSVLMPVRNAAPYLRAAMDSILAQSFSDFEFVIVDDGSEDDSRAILNSYSDKRIRLIDNSVSGLTAALNHGLAQCQGALIARMDADDIAYPDRLAAQVGFLDAQAETDILCSHAHLINASGERRGVHRMGPLDPQTLRAAFSYRIAFKPIIHPSVMMRSAVPRELGGYRDFVCCEDFDFWVRANARFRFGAIARPLLAYRQHAGGVSQRRRLQQATSGVMCVATHRVSRSTGVDIFERDRRLFDKYAACAQTRIAREILPAEEIFRVAAGSKLSLGAAALAVAVLRHGPAILPRGRRARLARLAETLAGEIEAELRARSARPAADVAAAVA